MDKNKVVGRGESLGGRGHEGLAVLLAAGVH
jgi:hypothetical protein